LTEGEHTIVIYVRNECGSQQLTWKVTRRVCRPPVVTITGSSAANGSVVTSDGFNLTATVSNVESQSEITVTQNGQVIGFVYNQQTGVLTLDRNLVLGANAFVILAKNQCGENSKTLNVLRNEVVTVPAPTIQITSPLMSPLETDQTAQTVQIVTTGVTSASQVSVTLNGVATNFEYNASGGIRFNATYVAGENVIVATAVTAGGTATDSKIVIYNAPEVIPAPVIVLTNPIRCPAVFQVGNVIISGTVQHVSNASQVSILYNGENVEFTSSIASNVLTFSFTVNVTAATVSVPLVITATNASGTDTKSCVINAAPQNGANGNGNGNNGHGNNTDGTDESNPGNGSGGPNGEAGGTTDDENGKGNGTETAPVRTTKPGTTTPITRPTTTPVKPTGRP
jgi:hypothetical protein